MSFPDPPARVAGAPSYLAPRGTLGRASARRSPAAGGVGAAGEAVGRLKLTVPEIAVPYVVAPVLAALRARHPRVEVEVVVENRLADIVAEGYDHAAKPWRHQRPATR